MAKKKYSKEFRLEREAGGYVRLFSLRKYHYTSFCPASFHRIFAIPRQLLTGRKHRVRITIEFLEEL